MTPTARTLKWLHSLGYQAEVVERWVPHAKIRKDLFGWCDIVAIGKAFTDADDVPQIIGIQCTSGANHSKRAAKATVLCGPWWKAGGLAYVVSWSKRGPRGKRKTWQVRVEVL